MATATKTAADPRFPSGRAIAFQTIIGAGEVHKYDVLPADHWVVQKHGDYVFVDAAVPERLWPVPGSTRPDWAQQEQTKRLERERERFLAAAKDNPVKLEVTDVLVCASDFPAWIEGQACTVKKGSRALVGSEAVGQKPENWKPAGR